MKFPNQLKSNNRTAYHEKFIYYKNLMYARHKPSYDWDIDNKKPDYSKIKADQSFNWSAFSIPIWTRFNDNKVYLSNYAIVAYPVDSIKNAHNFSSNLPIKAFGLRHLPIENNYSHSQIYFNEVLNNSMNRREIRYILQSTGQVKLLPGKQVIRFNLLFEILIMLKHRFQMLLNGLTKTS